ncbi:MAG: M56 family metallopeptidase, partial [Heliobacteriaceae bacterium]|nr:M56 family metallopeptidase [Heliobacteriaceae bacterium]
MDTVFLQILNMSITSGYVILFVIVARLLLKKVPKIFSYALWSVVLFRLVCPFSFESIFSLIPVNTRTIPQNILYSQAPQINSGITAIDQAVNNSLPAPIVSAGAGANPMQFWLALGEAVWLLGIAVLLIYSVFTTIRLYRKIKAAKYVSDNIYEINSIKTPFVFGIFKPKIYLPANLLETEKAYIIRHEQTHIKRFDHIIRPFAFLVLCVHWFNPLVWLAFFLMGEDMELSCDESVIKQMGNEIKKDYSTSLLSLSTGKRIIGGCPLAFGENNTK